MRKIEYKPLFKSKVKLVFNGKKKKINLIVDYNVSAKSFSTAAQELKEAAEQFDKFNTEQAYQNLQEKTKSLFTLAFGKESTQEIFEFFDNRAIEISMAFTPFILDVINPSIEKAAVKRMKE